MGQNCQNIDWILVFWNQLLYAAFMHHLHITNLYCLTSRIKGAQGFIETEFRNPFLDPLNFILV